MSCPCYGPLDRPDPWSDDDTAWQGDIHPCADWEALEALAGPEYWAFKALAEHKRLTAPATRTYWQGHE